MPLENDTSSSADTKTFECDPRNGAIRRVMIDFAKRRDGSVGYRISVLCRNGKWDSTKWMPESDGWATFWGGGVVEKEVVQCLSHLQKS